MNKKEYLKKKEVNNRNKNNKLHILLNKLKLKMTLKN